MFTSMNLALGLGSFFFFFFFGLCVLIFEEYLNFILMHLASLI